MYETKFAIYLFNIPSNFLPFFHGLTDYDKWNTDKTHSTTDS